MRIVLQYDRLLWPFILRKLVTNHMAQSNDMPEGRNSAARRSANTKFFIFVLVSGLLCFAAAAAGLYLVLRPQTLRIAVGPPGSDDVKIIQAMAQTFARERSHVRLSPEITDGATESISMLRQARIDLAVARGDLDMPADAQSVAILRKNVVVLWTPAGQGSKGAKKGKGHKIKDLAGLAGHKIAIIGRTEANVKLLHVILGESGIAPEKVAIAQFGTGEIADMARDPTIDAFMAVGPLNSKITADAIAATARSRGEPKFLGIDVADALVQKHPLYEAAEIPGSTFSSSPARPDDKVETVSLNHLIVARKSASEETIGAFTRQLFADRQALLKEVPGVATIEKPDTDKDAAIPAHRGAAAYIDGTERTFLERYSDYMWGALLLLSGLGSAGAWLRSYFKRGEKANNSSLRDRLRAMIPQARQCTSMEELDKMQIEVDEILDDTLNCYDDGAIEEGDLSAFGLLLEQFHRAVADRKATINQPASELARFRTR
jgi:TRAP transporter TAXI family solute receptor